MRRILALQLNFKKVLLIILKQTWNKSKNKNKKVLKTPYQKNPQKQTPNNKSKKSAIQIP